MNETSYINIAQNGTRNVGRCHAWHLFAMPEVMSEAFFPDINTAPEKKSYDPPEHNSWKCLSM